MALQLLIVVDSLRPDHLVVRSCLHHGHRGHRLEHRHLLLHVQLVVVGLLHLEVLLLSHCFILQFIRVIPIVMVLRLQLAANSLIFMIL